MLTLRKTLEFCGNTYAIGYRNESTVNSEQEIINTSTNDKIRFMGDLYSKKLKNDIDGCFITDPVYHGVIYTLGDGLGIKQVNIIFNKIKKCIYSFSYNGVFITYNLKLSEINKFDVLKGVNYNPVDIQYYILNTPDLTYYVFALPDASNQKKILIYSEGKLIFERNSSNITFVQGKQYPEYIVPIMNENKTSYLNLKTLAVCDELVLERFGDYITVEINLIRYIKLRTSKDDECIQCFENIKKRVAFVPCGHANICDVCAKTHIFCPVCCTEIKQKINLFL